jgi:glycosyltransferase involved in cell wall biosynthesis
VAIAGNGDLAAELLARAGTAGAAGHVQLLGNVPHHEVPALVAAADVAVAPSVHDAAGNVDGLPNTVMEIMASGTPLVATRVGGIGAVAEDGTTARLVPERDSRALADAIDSLLREPSTALALGRRARALVEREHSWARVAEDFEAVYQRC